MDFQISSLIINLIFYGFVLRITNELKNDVTPDPVWVDIVHYYIIVSLSLLALVFIIGLIYVSYRVYKDKKNNRAYQKRLEQRLEQNRVNTKDTKKTK